MATKQEMFLLYQASALTDSDEANEATTAKFELLKEVLGLESAPAA